MRLFLWHKKFWQKKGFGENNKEILFKSSAIAQILFEFVTPQVHKSNDEICEFKSLEPKLRKARRKFKLRAMKFSLVYNKILMRSHVTRVTLIQGEVGNCCGPSPALLVSLDIIFRYNHGEHIPQLCSQRGVLQIQANTEQLENFLTITSLA